MLSSSQESIASGTTTNGKVVQVAAFKPTKLCVYVCLCVCFVKFEGSRCVQSREMDGCVNQCVRSICAGISVADRALPLPHCTVSWRVITIGTKNAMLSVLHRKRPLLSVPQPRSSDPIFTAPFRTAQSKCPHNSVAFLRRGV